MPIARFQMPDGRVGRFEVPDGTTPEQAQSLIEQHLSANQPGAPAKREPEGLVDSAVATAQNVLPSAGKFFGGLYDAVTSPIQTAKGIGTLIKGGVQNVAYKAIEEENARRAKLGMAPVSSYAESAVMHGNTPAMDAADAVGQFYKDRYGGLGNIKRTIVNDPVGALSDASVAVSGGATLAGKTANLLEASRVASGANKLADIASAANPLSMVANTGGKVATAAGQGVAKAKNALANSVSPEVKDLYLKAKQLGIDVPVDRIMDSKPVNALASSLNYVPFSGRAAAEENMVSQLNRAVSRSFGQDSDNVTAALRKASDDLGAKFDKTLSSNTVKVDQQLLDDLATQETTAANELGEEGARIVRKQIDEIINKGQNGAIDGQAAYNIKKTLDRIGSRNSNEAYYARELKKSLMAALNRSLPESEAAEFAKLRKQYGNMLDIEGIAQNGAEGGVSIGRLANMKNINNPDLQDLADIAAQFVKARENPHGAAQRVTLGTLAGGAAVGTGNLPALGVGIGAGRATNALLNSQKLKNLLTAPALDSNAAALEATQYPVLNRFAPYLLPASIAGTTNFPSVSR